MSKIAIAALVFSVVSLGDALPQRRRAASSFPRCIAHRPRISRASPLPARHTSSAKPNSVEIDLEVSASSELTADAIVKYRDAKKRIHDAFAALKLKQRRCRRARAPGRPEGDDAEPLFLRTNRPTRRTKTEVQLTRKLVVKAADIRKMDEEAVLQLVGRLLDVAQDAGGKVGPQNNYESIIITIDGAGT